MEHLASTIVSKGELQQSEMDYASNFTWNLTFNIAEYQKQKFYVFHLVIIIYHFFNCCTLLNFKEFTYCFANQFNGFCLISFPLTKILDRRLPNNFHDCYRFILFIQLLQYQI